MADSRCPTCSFKSFTPTHLLSTNQRAQIRELLRAHAEPPEHLGATLSELTAELARYDGERTRYDTQIGRLQAAIHSLHAERSAVLAEHAALQAHYEDCRALSLRSPVRRLPVEILLTIFGLSSQAFPPTISIWADKEKHRIAYAPLFALSRVCARWHDIVMGNPALWSTIDFPENVWSDLHPRKMMSLLKTVLKLSHKSAVHVVLPGPSTASAKAFNLLLEHCERWRTASFRGYYADLEPLFKRRFPLLESLELRFDTVAATTADLFHAAPSLTRLVVSESLLRSTVGAHLSQLQILECVSVKSPKVTLAVALLSRLSLGTSCRLELQLGNQPHIPYLAPALSHVGTLHIEVLPGSHTPDVTDLVANLTLPDLENFTLRSNSALPWPHAAFLALSSRSSFHAHLCSLEVSDMAISAAELIECLSSLPALQRLEIADDRRTAVEPILTDSLLSSLTLRTDVSPSLLPSLQQLICRRTRLAFSDSALLSFILSRMQQDDEDQSESIFVMGVYWLQGRRRTLEPDVRRRINELRARRALVWTFAEEKERSV